MISLQEILDIYNEKMHHIGTATREEVHQTGAWHQTFHCWVLHRTTTNDYLLLQMRNETKDTHPNKLDISCAGHLDAGETPEDGVRELKEELGLQVPFDALHKVGVFKSSHKLPAGEDNEFTHVFILVHETEDLSAYQPAADEISGLFLISLTDMQDLSFGKRETVPVHGVTIQRNGMQSQVERNIERADMVPYPSTYFEALFQCLCTL